MYQTPRQTKTGQTDFRVSGSSKKMGGTGFFFLDHSIFTVMTPSGRGLRLPGIPA
jgi:hypothetical protein